MVMTLQILAGGFCVALLTWLLGPAPGIALGTVLVLGIADIAFNSGRVLRWNSGFTRRHN